ncbi:MAG: hypothetical protein LBR15_00495 [Methanobrevibacter sp.]|jgi:hypothetical protein|nr:hypothetical protein [Candidatus Methanovirga australis]
MNYSKILLAFGLLAILAISSVGAVSAKTLEIEMVSSGCWHLFDFDVYKGTFINHVPVAGQYERIYFERVEKDQWASRAKITINTDTFEDIHYILRSRAYHYYINGWRYESTGTIVPSYLKEAVDSNTLEISNTDNRYRYETGRISFDSINKLKIVYSTFGDTIFSGGNLFVGDIELSQ